MAPIRTLFDQEFIDSGCDPSLYDSQDAFDDTVGTYATDFAIGAIGFLFALLFLIAKKPFAWTGFCSWPTTYCSTEDFARSRNRERLE